LAPLREKLSFYPRDVWLYLLAAQWTRISQEEAFVGRCGDLGDELGSRINAARLVRDLMRLCFLMERRYAPYSKWLGSAFARLPGAESLGSCLSAALTAGIWQERERSLSAAYELVATWQNALGLAEFQTPQTRSYYGHAYQVIHGEVRTWTGWYRHIILALLAHAVLVVVLAQAQQEQELGRY
jgi:hypothetical protein